MTLNQAAATAKTWASKAAEHAQRSHDDTDTGGVSVADHIAILRAVGDIAQHTADHIGALRALAARSFGVHPRPSLMYAARTAAIAVPAIDSAVETTSKILLTTYREHRRREEETFPGSPLRRATSDALTEIRDAAESLPANRRATPDEFEEMLTDLARATAAYEDGLRHFKAAAFRACKRCRPGDPRNVRRAHRAQAKAGDAVVAFGAVPGHLLAAVRDEIPAHT